MRNVLAGFLAVAVLAVMGVGQVKAQSQTGLSDNASVNASINVFSALQITPESEDLDFGNAVAGNSLTINPSDAAAATFNLEGSTFGGVEIQLSWSTDSFSNGTSSFDWTPNVSAGGSSQTGVTGSISGLTDADGISVGGTADVPSEQAAGNYTSTVDLTVEYTGF